MSAEPDTYTPPAHGWTCFHCGETFAHENPARAHFGETPDQTPACLLKLTSEDRSLIRRVRGLEFEIERLRRDIECDATATEVFSGKLRSLLNSYRPFRGCRTLQDVFNVYDSMEGRALAAEETSVARCTCRDFPGADEFCTAHKAPGSLPPDTEGDFADPLPL